MLKDLQTYSQSVQHLQATVMEMNSTILLNLPHNIASIQDSIKRHSSMPKKVFRSLQQRQILFSHPTEVQQYLLYHPYEAVCIGSFRLCNLLLQHPHALLSSFVLEILFLRQYNYKHFYDSNNLLHNFQYSHHKQQHLHLFSAFSSKPFLVFHQKLELQQQKLHPKYPNLLLQEIRLSSLFLQQIDIYTFCQAVVNQYCQFASKQSLKKMLIH